MVQRSPLEILLCRPPRLGAAPGQDLSEALAVRASTRYKLHQSDLLQLNSHHNVVTNLLYRQYHKLDFPEPDLRSLTYVFSLV